MRQSKPPDPREPLDPRNDPNVAIWEDGSMWQYDDARQHWERLSGPAQEPAPRREAYKADREREGWDWRPLIYGVIILLALYGAVNLIIGFSQHSIGCHLGSTEGCYLYLPTGSHRGPTPTPVGTP